MSNNEVLSVSDSVRTDLFAIVEQHESTRSKMSPWAAQAYLEVVADDLGMDVQQLNRFLAPTRIAYYQFIEEVEPLISGGVNG